MSPMPTNAKASRGAAPEPAEGRLQSLDVYRGLVMFLLIGEASAFYFALGELDRPWLNPIVHQFEHVAWRGLAFWDLIQPAFMFIVGVAMAYSLRKRDARGEGWAVQFGHILWRCAVLFALGVGLHCWYADALVFELWNVLTQLSFTVLVAFLIFRWPWRAQAAVSVGLIVLADLLYRCVRVAPFDEGFVPGANFGSWVDTLLMGKINPGHWVAFNAVPTAAHTIWGVLAGMCLQSAMPRMRQGATLAAAGIGLIVLGYAMDAAGVVPIVKRICTSSFVVVSGGWCVLALAGFVWVFDVWKCRGGAFLLAVGMNPIVIYLIAETLAWGTLNPKVGVFVDGMLVPLGVSPGWSAVATAGVTWALLWGLCWWMYRRRIFVRI